MSSIFQILKPAFRLIVLIVITASATGGAGTSGQREKWKVLFVGNSLTYYNDLPAMVREIAAQDNITLTYETLGRANFSLEDHWREGSFQAALGQRRYNFVVAQQGPSALPDSRVLLVEYAAHFAASCAANNTRLAMYMVWPSASRAFDRKNVAASYAAAADETKSLLCPAGIAWEHAWETDPSLALYGPDGFHPSRMGTLLAALTIYGTLKGTADLGFVAHHTPLWKNDLSPAQFTILKAAAAKAIAPPSH